MNHGRRRTAGTASCALLGILVVAAGLRAQVQQDQLNYFLRKYVGLSEAQFGAMDRGEAIAKILDSNQPTVIPPFAVVRVKMSPDFFVGKYRDIETFKKSKEVLQIGKFHSPPHPEDLDGLTLDDSEVEALRKCKVGDCSMKLPAAMIDRFRKEMDWTAQEHARQATLIFRSAMLDYVKDYLAKGNAVLVTYVDKRSPLKLADEFRSLLQASPYLSENVPELYAYLYNYPDKRPGAAEDFIYWSKEKFGYKPVISLTHVTIYRPASQGSRPVVIASKQLFASHYFTASLGLSAFAEKVPGDPGGGYLFYLNRSQVDLPQGLFGGLIRYIVKRRVLDGLDKYVRLIKGRLESEYRTQPSTSP